MRKFGTSSLPYPPEPFGYEATAVRASKQQSHRGAQLRNSSSRIASSTTIVLQVKKFVDFV
jgi:hypothetical protein